MFKIKGTKSQGCCYCDKCKLVNRNYYYNDLIREGEIINYDQSIKEIIQAYNEIIFIYEK